MTPYTALMLVENEFKSAEKKHEPMHSSYEGYAIIKEELDELWEEIKKPYPERNTIKMTEEATQVAAMALRFMIDLL